MIHPASTVYCFAQSNFNHCLRIADQSKTYPNGYTAGSPDDAAMAIIELVWNTLRATLADAR